MWTILLPLATEIPPEPADVKQGLIGFLVFIGLIAAVTILGFSLTRHLRRAEANFGVPANGGTGPVASVPEDGTTTHALRDDNGSDRPYSPKGRQP